MTISTLDNKRVYNGNGSITNFTFNYKTLDATTIEVWEDNALTTAAVTVNVNADQDNSPGGSVDLSVAPANGVVVSVIRIESLIQAKLYSTQGAFPAKSHEGALDKLTLLVQQIDESSRRALKLSRVDHQQGDSVLPDWEAGKLLTWDSVLKKIVNSDLTGAGITSTATSPVLVLTDAEITSLVRHVFDAGVVAKAGVFVQANLPVLDLESTGGNLSTIQFINSGALIRGQVQWDETNDSLTLRITDASQVIVGELVMEQDGNIDAPYSLNPTKATHLATKAFVESILGLGISDAATAPVLNLADTSITSLIAHYFNGAAFFQDRMRLTNSIPVIDLYNTTGGGGVSAIQFFDDLNRLRMDMYHDSAIDRLEINLWGIGSKLSQISIEADGNIDAPFASVTPSKATHLMTRAAVEAIFVTPPQTNPPLRALLQTTTGTLISAGALVRLTFDTSAYNDGITITSSQFIIPAGYTKARFTAGNSLFSGVTGWTSQMHIRRNANETGIDAPIRINKHHPAAVSGVLFSNLSSGIMRVVAGEAWEVVLSQTAGVDITTAGSYDYFGIELFQ